MAGLLDLAAGGGARVHLVCATRGEQGVDWAAGDPPRHLASVRSEELARSCLALGAEPPRFLDLRDGELAVASRGLAIAAIVDVLRDLRPDVLVTLGPDGAYGHADHIVLWELARLALAAAQTGEAALPDVRHLSAAFPAGFFLPQWQRMSAEPDGALVNHSPPSLGVAASDVALRVRPARERKREVIGAHRSQLPDGTPESLFPDGLVEALLTEEWFAVASGPALPEGAQEPFAGLA